MYNAKITLKDYEKIAKVDARTGQIEFPKEGGNPDMMRHDRKMIFKKFYPENWQLLKTQTTDKEFLVAFALGLRAKAYTNSLEPLGPATTASVLAEMLGEDRRTIYKKIDKLLKLGVLGTFCVYDINGNKEEYWLFNPYLSFNGRVISKDIAELFERTIYAKNSTQLIRNDRYIEKTDRT